MWEVVSGIVGGDVPSDERRERAADLFGLRLAQIDGAMAYYAEFTDQIDGEIKLNLDAADEAEALWLRQQTLLAE